VALSASSYACWYSSQCWRSARSLVENFQRFGRVVEPAEEAFLLLITREVQKTLTILVLFAVADGARSC